MKTKKIPPASTYREYPLLVKSLLSYSLILSPEREIVYRDQSRYDYHELNRRVRRLAGVLEKLGLDGGETVAVMDYDSHRYLECYFGIPMTGNVLHMINWRLSPAQILYTINHAEDRVLIVHTDFLPMIATFAGQMPTVKFIIVVTDGDTLSADKLNGPRADALSVGDPDTLPVGLDITGEYEPLLAAASDQYTFPDFDEEAVATTFYTTGTTGDPKGVYFTHRQLVLHTLNLAATYGFVEGASCRFRSDDVYMPLTPMFHVHAWGFPFLATMFSMKQVYPGKLAPPIVAALIEKEKPTFSHCVPTVLQMILLCPEAKALNLSGWKVMVGGSALPKALAKMALDRGVDVMVGYGMSETCPVIACCHIPMEDRMKDRQEQSGAEGSSTVEEQPGAEGSSAMEGQLSARTRTGIPTILTDIQVWDEAGRPVKADDRESGEVVVRSPWLTHGYVKDPERGAALWKDGYLHTGDVATINARHSLKISDRIKDVIKSGGEWISSIDLEGLIGLHLAVAEVAVVGLPHPKWGERPYALVVLRSDLREETKNDTATESAGSAKWAAILKDHIRQFIEKGQISKWAMPEEIRFVEAIPKTSVGKIDKKRIRLISFV
jgi:fatty-acyl-CoA synthase